MPTEPQWQAKGMIIQSFWHLNRPPAEIYLSFCDYFCFASEYINPYPLIRPPLLLL